MAENHMVDGHDVIEQDGIIYIDGVQATLGRPDFNVVDVLKAFFEHVLLTDVGGTRRERRAQEVPELPVMEENGLGIVNVPPGATIIINIEKG